MELQASKAFSLHAIIMGRQKQKFGHVSKGARSFISQKGISI
jgi:hypothetical protein